MNIKTDSSALLITGLFILLTLAGAACGPQTEEMVGAESVIRVGVLPDESEEILRQKYEPLLEYLSAETERQFKLIPHNTYDELIDNFNAGKIDLSLFGGYAFALANKQSGAIPLALRDMDTRFTSYFLVRSDSALTDISQFQGKDFSFGSKKSTSGHLMPRHFLNKNNIQPEKFFKKVLYSGAHDKTVYMVREGKASVGAVNSSIVQNMVRDGRIDKSEIKILWETPPYVNYVWTVQRDMPESSKAKILNAFLKLAWTNDDHQKILRLLGANFYLPASIEDFKELKSTVELLRSRIKP